MNERKIAVKILYEIEQNNAYTNIILSKTFKNGDFLPEEKGFITELVHGVTERKITLDYVISKFSSVKINKISTNILNVLRIGIYQIFYMNKIPVSAAVNESVKLAKVYGGHKTGGFVNAVLRNAERNIENISYPDQRNQFLSVFYSYPMELVDFFVKEFGFDFTEQMLKSNSERKSLTIRCNALKTTPDKLVENLRKDGINAKVYENPNFPEMDYAIVVDKIKNIDSLQSFKNGEFYVQDVAAMLVCDILDPKSGNTVIDMCAAPGGKTTHISEKMLNKGQVYAFDIYEHKLSLIKENALRLGIDICDCQLRDATKLYNEYINKADCVLVDAPCSGLGIIGKKPDIKYQRTVEDINALADISFSILCNGAEYVKDGGTLVFSTCTITKAENENVVEKFLDKYGESFCLEPITQINKENCGYVTLYPHIDNVDGFFICKFKKRRRKV